eukprot:GAHX01000069.1.p1 GENE.GAHX01000069.1~~GAHX01000069.1.p1  ORF type:complete len:137 (-),score=34.34 GAHX01000069.1:41-412(-)
MNTFETKNIEKLSLKEESEDDVFVKMQAKVVSNNKETMTAFMNALEQRCKEQNIKVFGTAMLPTKRLRITTRRSPCGQGSNTYENYTQKVHKRLFTFNANNTQSSILESVKTPGNLNMTIRIA